MFLVEGLNPLHRSFQMQDSQGCVRKLDLASSGLFFVWTASSSIDDTTNIACFAVLARRKTARSRANDGVL
jgi:hypothetical protein